MGGAYMIKQYRGADRAINYLFENAKEISVQRYLTTGTLIATLSIDDVMFDLYSAGGDNVAWNQLSISGTKIAQISINGTVTDIYAPTAGGATALSGLSDVNLFSPTDGQILKYDATNQVWINANESGSSSTLDGLLDVSITTPTDGQVLTYDATSGEWVNSNAGGDDGIDYSTTEQDTGIKWVDNKPIYQKTVNIGKILSTGTNVYTLGITGVDSIIDYSIIPMQRANSDIYNVDNGDVTWNQGSYFVRHFQNDSSVGLKIAVYSGNYLSEDDIYVTVWYTKTT